MTKMQKHKNIPFFIPHLGCKHDCIFCSQEKITEQSRADGSAWDFELNSLKETLEDFSRTCIAGPEYQIAFFGGSFTGIERDRMISLLQTAAAFIGRDGIAGIRISTRPDCIDSETLDILRFYGVTDIELGIQTVSDKVLAYCRRGHSTEQSLNAMKMVLDGGFRLTGQMMIGLPLSTLSDEIETAKAICSHGAVSARIYPTVVFEDTELCALYRSGGYKPLTNAEAVERSAECLEIFSDNGVDILRIGLHSSESLAKAEAGASHPAIGELVEARLYKKRIYERLKNMDSSGKKLMVVIPDGETSKLTGHGGIIDDIKQDFHLADIKIAYGDVKKYFPIIKEQDG